MKEHPFGNIFERAAHLHLLSMTDASETDTALREIVGIMEAQGDGAVRPIEAMLAERKGATPCVGALPDR